MTLQKNFGDLKDTIFLEESSSWFSNLPKKAAKRVKAFVERNSLAVVACNLKDKSLVHCFCPNCLKAYMINSVEKNGIKSFEAAEKLDCEIGHEGFYMDGKSLVKI